MADTITLTSTTDTEAQVKTALGIPTEAVVTPVTPAEPVEATLPLEPADEDAVEEAEAIAAEPAPSTKHVAAGKKRGRLQSRIDELVGERDRMRGSVAAQEAELTAYRKRVADLVALPAPKAAEVPTVAEAKAAVAAGKPKVEDFETYEDYTEAMASWTVKGSVTEQVKALVDARLLEERTSQARQQEQYTASQMQRRYAQAEVAVRAKYDDYQEAINAPDLQASDLMIDQMLRSEQGPEVAYYLGKHPDQCKRLYALGNTPEAIKQFGKIEARVEAALEAAAASTAVGSAGGDSPKALAAVAPPAGKKPAVTKAPDPITPVGAGAQGTTVDPQNMSYQDFKEWRNTQERKRLGYR